MMRLLLVIAIALTYTVWHFSSAEQGGTEQVRTEQDRTAPTTEQVVDDRQYGQQNDQDTHHDHARLQQAFQARERGVEVQGSGRVIKVLPDDNEGSRHQRFILRITQGSSAEDNKAQDMTVLLAHNIDLAPRLEGLQLGDEVFFSGIYEWNAKGGVVHWTHHDPRGQHKAGWLRYKGTSYQ